MTVYLGAIPGHYGFQEIPLDSDDDKRSFVKGSLDYILLPFGIKVWGNEVMLNSLEWHEWTLAINYGVKTIFIFGNAFLAGHDAEGNTIPLSEKQAQWINEHSSARIVVGSKHPINLIQY